MVARFGDEVRRRVGVFADGDVTRRAYRRLHRQGLVVVLWFVASYAGIVLARGWVWGSVACVSLTLAMVAVGFDIMHDANHNAFFPATGQDRLTTANRLAGLSLNALGGSARTWIEGHVNRHHRAPNVVGMDDDIDQAPFVRLAPAQRRRPWHALQQYYAWLLYAFTAAAFILGDIAGTLRDAFVREGTDRRRALGDLLCLLPSKGLFVTAFLVVPLLLHPWWVVAVGGLAVLAGVGVLLGVVFQLAHAVTDTEFAQSPSRPKIRWHEWQVRATADFCHGQTAIGRTLTWYIGGLNYQIEHHLFPELPHTLYPDIAPIVECTCAEFAIPYRLQPTLRAAIRSHYGHLLALGRPTSAQPREQLSAEAVQDPRDSDSIAERSRIPVEGLGQPSRTR